MLDFACNKYFEIPWTEDLNLNLKKKKKNFDAELQTHACSTSHLRVTCTFLLASYCTLNTKALNGMNPDDLKINPAAEMKTISGNSALETQQELPC